jgi:putative OPT family oligopeptide transporter
MSEHETFHPVIPSGKIVPEFTVRACILGVLLGVFFNLGNTYLGLKVGMTISASIPAAVLSMAILRIFFKNVSILENNIVQTIASVGEGLAAGIIFSIPALYLLGESVSNFKVFVLSFLGGILGILFMIPMRRYIIVKEHGVLPFPEGAACAEILKAGAKEAGNAALAVCGIIVGALYKLCIGAFHLWDDLATFVITPFEGTQFRIDGTPSLLGVGYIIGPRIAAVTFAGGALGWWVLIPLIKMYGAGHVVIFPGTTPITQMDAMTIWSDYIRYIGAGCVAIGGIYNLIGIAPMIAKTVHIGFKELFGGFKQDPHQKRTDTDISMAWLILGSVAIILLLWLLPTLNLNLFTIVLLVILGYFFVAVTSITVGLVGSSSNPASGMVITTLLITGLIFAAIGWTERIYLVMAITMSSVVNVAIGLAATTSQDLKTGFLVGATPRWQQITEIIGLLVPSLIIGAVLTLLNKAYVFGSPALPAPQATLIAIIAKGVINHQLPTILVLMGIFLGLIVILLRAPILPFAIGLYLPLEISTAIMVGGLVRFFEIRIMKSRETDDAGILTASGLVAGDACIGVVIALLTVIGWVNPNAPSLLGPTYSAFFFLLLTLLFLGVCLKSKKR